MGNKTTKYIIERIRFLKDHGKLNKKLNLDTTIVDAIIEEFQSIPLGD